MSLILTNDNVTFKIQSPRVTYSTVSDMQNVAVPTEGDCVTVTDEGQGGTFIYRVSNAAINNGGTIFNGWTREYSGAVNVKWFGADGTPNDTDDGVLINAALEVNGTVYIEDGGYTITTPIQMADQVTVLASNNAKSIDTQSTNVILYGNNNDAVIKHTVTQTQATARTLFYGGKIGQCTIQKNGSFTCKGVVLESFWQGRLECSIKGLLNDAISIDKNATFVTAGITTDFYASPFVNIESCTISSNIGIGLSLTNFSSSIMMDNCYITGNTMGAFKIASSANRIHKCSIAANGATSLIAMDFYYEGATSMNNVISRCEIDNNYGTTIKANTTRLLVEYNRFINTNDTNAYLGSICIDLNNVNISSNSNSEINQNYFDFRNAGTPIYTVIRSIDGSTNLNNVARDNVMITVPATVTKYDMCNRYKNYAIEEGDVVYSGSTSGVGSNMEVDAGTSSSTNYPTINTEYDWKLNTIKYSVGKVWNSTVSDYFDVATSIFTAPHKGILNVSGIMTFKITAINTLATIRVRNTTAATLNTTNELFPSISDYSNLSINQFIAVNSGDQIKITVACDQDFWARGETENVKFKMM